MSSRTTWLWVSTMPQIRSLSPAEAERILGECGYMADVDVCQSRRIYADGGECVGRVTMPTWTEIKHQCVLTRVNGWRRWVMKENPR